MPADDAAAAAADRTHAHTYTVARLCVRAHTHYARNSQPPPSPPREYKILHGHPPPSKPRCARDEGSPRVRPLPGFGEGGQEARTAAVVKKGERERERKNTGGKPYVYMYIPKSHLFCGTGRWHSDKPCGTRDTIHIHAIYNIQHVSRFIYIFM